MALDDFEDRFATAVKQALNASRGSGDDDADASGGSECPSSDLIASYYEYALNRVERARLETHFSGCARCQATLAALLRAAPMVDAASEAGGFATAAARRAAAESAGVRERWIGINPAWRVAGVTAAATAMLAVIVVAGMHVYRGWIGRESGHVAVLNATPRHHRHKFHHSSSNELALNENKSVMPVAPTEPRTVASRVAAAQRVPTPDIRNASPAAVPSDSTGQMSAAASVGGTSRSSDGTTAASSGSPKVAAETLFSPETVPPIASANAEQNDATAATAAQAAAALGALASTPAPAATAAPSIATSVAAASATADATHPASGGAATVESKDTAAAIAVASIVGAIGQGADAAPKPAATAATPASETTAQAATGVTPGAVNQKQQELAVLAAPPSQVQRLQKETAAQAPVKASEAAAKRNSRQSGSRSDGELTDNADGSAVSARERAARELLAEKKLKADITRRAELARKAEQAKREADLKRQMDRARRNAQAKSARTSPAGTSPAIASSRSQSGDPRHMQVAAVPFQSRRALDGAGDAASRIGEAQAAAPPAAPSGAGNTIAMANRPLVHAPVVAAIAPGIPVAPRAILVSPPDHSVYWSLQNSGLIYRTNDRKSWTPQFTGVQADLLAGMAPSDTVCWAVGRKGVILLTTDGRHWERVKAPTTSDLTGITAASKDVATIFVANGANYSTFDGGSNWEQAH